MTLQDELVAHYFHEGYSYALIVCFLHYVDGITISLRQLKRILQRLKLRRRYSPNRAHLAQAEVLVRVRSQSVSHL